jgi:O-antigen/teichoic acid export membrane protein
MLLGIANLFNRRTFDARRTTLLAARVFVRPGGGGPIASVYMAASPAKSGLRGIVAWIFAGNTLFAAAQWGMLAVLAKIGNPSLLGVFSLGLAITAPPILFATALRGSHVTDIDEEYSVMDYFLARSTLLVIACVCIGLFTLTQHYSRQTTLVIVWITVAKIFDSFSDGIYAYLMRHEFMHRVSISRILQGATQLIVVFLLMKQTKSLYLTTIAFAAASAAVTFCYDLPSLGYVSSRITSRQPNPLVGPTRIRTIWNLIQAAAPLGLVTVLIPLMATVPRYVVERDLGPAPLGVFSALSYVTVAGLTVATAVGTATLPRLSKYFAARDRVQCIRLIRKLLILTALMSGLLILVTALFGPALTKLLYTASYAHNNALLIMLVCGSAFCYLGSVLSFCMTAARQFSKQVIAFIPALIVTTVLSFWLTKNSGLMGTGLAMMMGWITHLTISAVIVYRSLLALDRIKKIEGVT